MQKFLFILFLFIYTSSINAQELNCNVTVAANQVSGSNKQVFKTLEKSISDFMNKTKWSNKKFKIQEKIQCVLTINISEQVSTNHFKGSLQLQVVRPVFNSTYLTPVLNYNDKDIEFTYEEFEQLQYNENNFESNLVSLLSFYANIILGVDADSFSLNGGDTHFKQAEKITLLAQQGNAKGWNSIDGNFTRFQLVDSMLNSNYTLYRNIMYNYHLNGLDVMTTKKTKAKKNIAKSVSKIKNIYLKRPSAYLLRIFLDTKADEITSIFKDGPKIDTRNLVEALMKVYPARNDNWAKIH